MPRTTPVASSYYIKYSFRNWFPFLEIVEIGYTTHSAYEIEDFITMVQISTGSVISVFQHSNSKLIPDRRIYIDRENNC